MPHDARIRAESSPDGTHHTALGAMRTASAANANRKVHTDEKPSGSGLETDCPCKTTISHIRHGAAQLVASDQKITLANTKRFLKPRKDTRQSDTLVLVPRWLGLLIK